MPGPILFFIIIIAIDLILKSAKDKKRIDEARNRSQDTNKQPNKPKASRPMADLRKILAEEIEKERKRELARGQELAERQKSSYNENKPKTNKVEKKEKILETKRHEEDSIDNRRVYNIPVENKAENKTGNKDNGLKEDILRGLIFSEILSEPKSLQNQRRGL